MRNSRSNLCETYEYSSCPTFAPLVTTLLALSASVFDLVQGALLGAKGEGEVECRDEGEKGR